MAKRDQVAVVAAMPDAERAHARRRADGEIYVACCSVNQQAQRIQGGGQPGPEYMADGRLFAESVRWAIRAGELCAILAEPDRRPVIEAALSELRATLPDAVKVRDVLEHFDDYLLNVGNLQRRGGDDYSQIYKRGDTHEVIAGPISIQVEEAVRVVDHLATAVLVRPEVVGS